MELGSLLVVILLFFLSGLFVLRPFLIRTESSGRAGATLRDSLVADKERLLQAIEEIDLEYELNKISSEEHTRSRDLLMSEAAGVLKELDKLPKTRSQKKVKSAPAEDDTLEKMIAERRKHLQKDRQTRCPHCGEAVAHGAQFCSQCGGAL